MAGDARPYALAPGAGETISNPVGGNVVFKARGPETRGALTVFETLVAAGDGPPLHLHEHEDEAMYVLEGAIDVRLGDDLHHTLPGTFVFIPRGAVHAFQNVGDGTARMLVIFTPSGMERFFELTAEAGTSSGDREAFAAAGGEVGMAVVGPPLAASHQR